MTDLLISMPSATLTNKQTTIHYVNFLHQITVGVGRCNTYNHIGGANHMPNIFYTPAGGQSPPAGMS